MKTENLFLVFLFDLLRSALVLCHLVIFGLAISTVILSDISILRGELDSGDIEFVGRIATRLFIGLWMSGLIIIYMDTGFDVEVLVEKPKLLLKIVCVFTLTLNAAVLHHFCLNILASNSPLTLPKARILSACGAISSSHWLLAAFVGSARMLNNYSFNVLFVVYCIFLLLTVCIALLIAPILKDLLNLQRAHRVLATIGLERSPSEKTIRQL